MEETDRNQYLAVKQACDAEIEAAEKKIAELSKAMVKEVRIYRDVRLNGSLKMCLMRWLAREGRPF